MLQQAQNNSMTLRTISSDEVLQHLDAFVALLQDAVGNGASIGFLPPLANETAAEFWREYAAEIDERKRVIVAAFDERLVGCVTLALATKPNAPHRAEVQKLIVRSDCRRRGIGRELMQAVEDESRKRGRTLLVLDTLLGDSGEQLYPRLGYVRVGEIPSYVINENGELLSTVVFYKILGDPSLRSG